MRRLDSNRIALSNSKRIVIGCCYRDHTV